MVGFQKLFFSEKICHQTTLFWNPTKTNTTVVPRETTVTTKNLPKKGPIHPSPNGYVSSCGHAIVVAWSDISWAGEVVRCFMFNLLRLNQFVWGKSVVVVASFRTTTFWEGIEKSWFDQELKKDRSAVWVWMLSCCQSYMRVKRYVVSEGAVSENIPVVPE